MNPPGGALKITPVLVFSLLVMASGAAVSQSRPDWIPDGVSSKYPEPLYITGFGMTEGENAAERMESAVQKARADLSSRFLVMIRSEVLIHQSEANQIGFSDVRNTVSARTRFRLIDVPAERWDDPRHKTAYALAVMEKESAIRNYSARLPEIGREIKGLIRLAEGAVKKKDTSGAIDLYRKTFPLYLDAEETVAVLGILRKNDAFADLDSAASVAIPLTRTEIESRIDALLKETISTAQGAAFSIAEQLKAQWTGSGAIAAYPFTYRDTDFASQFSGYFHDALSGELAKTFRLVSPDTWTGTRREPLLTLTGNYWGEGESIRLTAVLADTKTGRKLGFATVMLNAVSVERAGIEIKPKNFIQAAEDEKIFLQRDVIPGGLSLAVWSTRGSANIILKRDDGIEFIVRVNKPCFLRVIYHLASGPRILLFDNHYFDVSKVNLPYTLPKRFKAAPPFGVERLQVFARETEFPPVRLSSGVFDGVNYDNVFGEDIAQYIARSRGLVEDIDENAIPVAVDRVVTITTVERTGD